MPCCMHARAIASVVWSVVGGRLPNRGFSEWQELRGNIRVYVRAKPLSDDEARAGVASVVRCDSEHRVSCFFQGATRVPPPLSGRVRPRLPAE